MSLRSQQSPCENATSGMPRRSEESEKMDTGKQNVRSPEPEEMFDLYHVTSHGTHHDMPHITELEPRARIGDKFTEAGDEVYDRFSPRRKACITAILSFCAFLSPISSTAVLAAVPEVAETFNTTGTIVNVTNALYLIFMGLSPLCWGPLGQVYGRRKVCMICATLFFAFSVGTALAPNLAAFFIFRVLTAFQGTAFLITGSSAIGDIYRPVDRATALSWFLSGTLVGPALGPFTGGIIVTFVSWRVIYWLQTALAVVATLLVIFFLPETIHVKRSDELKGLSKREYAVKLWRWGNPWRVIKLFRYPNLLITSVASSALVWNMYSLLTPIRYVLNPRFHLDSPLQSGLFYIAPGCGYLLGTFFGGRWADYVVRKWIRKRNGERIAEDRLRSCVFAMGVVIPGCMLVYGWSVEKAKGGVALPVIVMFIQGIAQLFCFPSLNTYCLDVMQKCSGEVVAGNYMVRYLFAAFGTAVCLPAIEKIGVGWFSTISALFLVVAALAVVVEIRFGKAWRDKIDAARKATKNGTSQNEAGKENQ